MNRAALVLLLSWLVVGAAEAHKDRILSVQSDGVIPELPAAYSATRLHIAFSSTEGGSLSGLRFISSGRENSLQQCLLRLVSASSAHRLSLYGSWYHSESILPHYLSVEFQDTAAESRLPEPPGVRLLFSLRDASLLSVTRVVPVPHEAAVLHKQIKLSNGCPA
jgi:hypothetical protein